MRDRKPEQISAERGSKTQSREPEEATMDAVKARSHKDQSRRAKDPDEPQVELEGES
jgi:hypothetical protein